MTRTDVPAASVSMAAHAAVLLALLFAATHSSDLALARVQVSDRIQYVFTPRPGPGSSGGSGGPTIAPPRAARMPESRPVNTTAPDTIAKESMPTASVPILATQDVEILPGALSRLDGTAAGRGLGPGAGGGRGPGYGPGDGPGASDVYEPGTGGVSDPKLIHEVKPNFTADAMRAKIQGVVVMEIVVLADGTVDPARIRITHSLEPGLDQQAVIAVKQWRFDPSRRLGKAVAARATVELTFTLR